MIRDRDWNVSKGPGSTKAGKQQVGEMRFSPPWKYVTVQYADSRDTGDSRWFGKREPVVGRRKMVIESLHNRVIRKSRHETMSITVLLTPTDLISRRKMTGNVY